MPLSYMGRGTGLGMAKESTWGTAVSRTDWMELVSSSLARTVDRTYRPHLVGSDAGGPGSAVRQEVFDGADNVGGDVEFEGVYNAVCLGHVLFAAMGTAATTGSGPYTHTLTMGATLPSWTMEFLRGTGKAADSEVFEGMKCSSLTLSQAVNDIMRVRTNWIGQTSGGRESGGSPTYTSSAAPILHTQAGSLTWNSVTYAAITSAEINIDNALERRQFLGSAVTTEPDFSGWREITLNLSLHWNSTTDSLQAGFIAGTSSDAVINWTGSGNNRLNCTIHNCIVISASDPISSEGVVTQSVTLRGRADSSDSGVAIALINDTAGGSYDW